MAIQANWGAGTGVVVDEDGDPFETCLTPRVQTRYDPHQELRRLLQSESALFNCGVICEIKDTEGVVCSVCPLNHSGEDDHPLRRLCEIGQTVERVVTEMAVASIHG